MTELVALSGLKGAGRYLIIDGPDLVTVSLYPWWLWEYPGRGPYACARVNGRLIKLHTFLTGWPRVDHRNGNGLDCTRANMREATCVENGQNRRKHAAASSQFKGVYSHRGKWRARIKTPAGRLSLGCYATEELAARVYDVAALEYFGEFSCLNFPV